MCFCLAAICCYLAATPIFLVLVISVVTVCCMPTHKVSKDLKAQIPALFHQEGLNIKEICVLLGLKKTVVYQTLSHVRAYGVPYNPQIYNAGGRKCVLSQADLKFIVALLNHRHSIYVDEIQERLSNEHETFVSITTLLCTLQRLGYSHKAVSARALERDNLLCSAFMNRITDEVMNPDMLMFVDEAARNKRTSARMKGWSLVGKRCMQRRYFGRGQRFSILPILTLDSIITYDIVPGAVTSERFLQFLRELVVCISVHIIFALYLTQHTILP
jgi:transposase